MRYRIVKTTKVGGVYQQPGAVVEVPTSEAPRLIALGEIAPLPESAAAPSMGAVVDRARELRNEAAQIGWHLSLEESTRRAIAELGTPSIDDGERPASEQELADIRAIAVAQDYAARARRLVAARAAVGMPIDIVEAVAAVRRGEDR